MDEVIFAGNSRRRPLGMAEVTLTFDNSDGALATPFTEVAVTRRAYRSGDGEYFLNRSQVRLRDVMDLLIGAAKRGDQHVLLMQHSEKLSEQDRPGCRPGLARALNRR